MIGALSRPDLSVLVPTHNRRELIKRCLESLARQDHPLERFEVIVVDDGSEDDTQSMLGSIELGLRLTVLSPGAVGQSAARNAAIDAAESEICVLLDDDVIASPVLVPGHLEAHRADPRTVAIGALTQAPLARRDWYADAFRRSWTRHYNRLRSGRVDWTHCYGGNFSAPREALLDVGGFATDISISKDIEIGYRLEQSGWHLTYLAEARAVHDDQKPRRRLLRDVERQGSGYIDLVAKHPGMGPKLLGSFNDASSRELALRQALLALRVSPELLAMPGGLFRSQGLQDLAYEFLRKYAFWLAVRRRVDRRQWRALTQSTEPDLAVVTEVET